jgi:hypothetical protein
MQDLERSTEHLSELSELPLERVLSIRGEITNLTVTTRKV